MSAVSSGSSRHLLDVGKEIESLKRGKCVGLHFFVPQKKNK